MGDECRLPHIDPKDIKDDKDGKDLGFGGTRKKVEREKKKEDSEMFSRERFRIEGDGDGARNMSMTPTEENGKEGFKFSFPNPHPIVDPPPSIVPPFIVPSPHPSPPQTNTTNCTSSPPPGIYTPSGPFKIKNCWAFADFSIPPPPIPIPNRSKQALPRIPQPTGAATEDDAISSGYGSNNGNGAFGNGGNIDNGSASPFNYDHAAVQYANARRIQRGINNRNFAPLRRPRCSSLQGEAESNLAETKLAEAAMLPENREAHQHPQVQTEPEAKLPTLAEIMSNPQEYYAQEEARFQGLIASLKVETKLFYCYVCKSEVKVLPGMICPFCLSDFLEERETATPAGLQVPDEDPVAVEEVLPAAIPDPTNASNDYVVSSDAGHEDAALSSSQRSFAFVPPSTNYEAFVEGENRLRRWETENKWLYLEGEDRVEDNFPALDQARSAPAVDERIVEREKLRARLRTKSGNELFEDYFPDDETSDNDDESTSVQDASAKRPNRTEKLK